MATLAVVLTVVLCPDAAQAAEQPKRIARVEASPASFNPSLGQQVSIRVTTRAAGELSCAIVDRDGYTVRQLRKAAAAAGVHDFSWDGRDERAAVVADEAYSLLVRLDDGRGSETYAPARDAHGQHAASTKIEYYDRVRGVVAYRLAKASRVHLQAGTAKPARDGKRQGVAMVNIVDSEPRPAGGVVEHWTGFDASKLVFVPDLPHFVLSMVTVPLPESSIIAVGNTKRTYVAQTRQRRGTSILPAAKPGAHHSSLAGTDDRAPMLTVGVPSCTGSGNEFRCASAPKQVRASLGKGEYLESFSRQPRTLQLYVDGDLIAERKAAGVTDALPLPRLGEGSHLITMNWVSDHGPLATGSARVNVSRGAAASGKASR
jgi:hypothetical protein